MHKREREYKTLKHYPPDLREMSTNQKKTNENHRQESKVVCLSFLSFSSVREREGESGNPGTICGLKELICYSSHMENLNNLCDYRIEEMERMTAWISLTMQCRVRTTSDTQCGQSRILLDSCVKGLLKLRY